MSSHNKTFIECTLYLEMHLKCCTLDLKFEHSSTNLNQLSRRIKAQLLHTMSQFHRSNVLSLAAGFRNGMNCNCCMLPDRAASVRDKTMPSPSRQHCSPKLTYFPHGAVLTEDGECLIYVLNGRY